MACCGLLEQLGADRRESQVLRRSEAFAACHIATLPEESQPYSGSCTSQSSVHWTSEYGAATVLHYVPSELEVATCKIHGMTHTHIVSTKSGSVVRAQNYFTV